MPTINDMESAFSLMMISPSISPTGNKTNLMDPHLSTFHMESTSMDSGKIINCQDFQSLDVEILS